MIYCAVYSINDIGQEIWIKNLPERDFTQDNPAFIKSNSLFSINKGLLLDVAMKFYKKLYDIRQPCDCPVCFESISSDEKYVTSCKHIFCEKPGPFHCPICRKDLCISLITTLKNISVKGLYEIYCDVIHPKTNHYISQKICKI